MSVSNSRNKIRYSLYKGVLVSKGLEAGISCCLLESFIFDGQRMMNLRSRQFENNRPPPCANKAKYLARLFSELKPMECACLSEGFSSNASNIKVAIRLRPLMEKEIDNGQENAWSIDKNTIYLNGRNSSSIAFSFDHVFGSEIIKTKEIFDNVAQEIVDATLQGFNGTIFAYGQTSAGKTFTMKGSDQNEGVIPLAISHIFRQIQNTRDRDFNVRCSYLEIYNEIITDLLDAQSTNLKIHQSLSSGIFVGNLTEEPVSCFKEAFHLLQKGEEKRHIGATNINEYSSRSHTIFRMVIESKELANSRDSFIGPLKISTLTFVDLAGSERISTTCAEGIRLKEGGHINKSLLALTSVISKLSEGNDRSHIPYRDSKLTRILQPSLGGNAKTAIICALTPSNTFIEESISTLKFASRAKTIKNKAHINEIISDEDQIKRCCDEIKELKKLLSLQLDDHESDVKRSKTNQSEILALIKSAYLSINAMKMTVKSFDIAIFPQLKELYEEFSFLELEAKTNSIQFQEVSKHFHVLNDELTDMKVKYTEALNECECLHDYKIKAENLDDSLNELKAEFTSVEEAFMQDIAALRSENQILQVSQERLLHQLQCISCPACASLSDHVKNLSKAVELLEDALRKCPKQSNIDALEVDFQRQIDVYEKLNDESMNLNNQLREEVEKCNQDVAELMAKLANVQKQERNMEGKFQQEIDSLTFELDAAKSNISNLQEKLEILFKEREAIEISSNDAMLQLDALVIIKTKLESEIKDINAKCIEANQTICQNDELIKSLESKLEAIELEHAENNLRMDEIIKGQKSKEQEIIDEKFKLSTLENEKKMLELRISEKDNKMSNLKEENDSLYRNICKLQEQAQTLIKENANLKINIDKSQSDMELSSELEFRLSKTEADRNLLQLENSRIQQQLHIWEEDAKIWKIEKEKLSEMLKRANEQKLELEERLLSSVNANDFNILKSQNEEKITFLESKLFDAEERFNALQKSSVSNAKEILLRIELEKSKESFQKEKRLLQLRISELEEYCNRETSNREYQHLLENYEKLKKENGKLIELRAADEHKLQYYASLVKTQTPFEHSKDTNRAESKENIHEKQAKKQKDTTSIATDPATGECKQQ